MEARATSPEETLFGASRQAFEGLVGRLAEEDTLQMRHDELESLIEKGGREVLRKLLQDHLELRAAREKQLEQVQGADGVERRHRREHERGLMTVLGPVTVRRTGYGAPGSTSLHPMDEQLNLPPELYSHEVRKRVAQEVARGAYEEAVKTVEDNTGAAVPKRQAEQLAARAAQDFEAFYQARQAASVEEAANTGRVLVITSDAKGVPMRREHLREQTRKAAETQQHKMAKRLSKGEKRQRKRMAQVASVYTVAPHIRTPGDIMADLRPLEEVGAKSARPKPEGKRVWASLEKETEAVLEDAFEEASRRDPKRQKEWVAVVDGNIPQLNLMHEMAARYKVTLIIILDLIHVLEYLWKACWAFHEESDPAAQEWVDTHLLRVLQGHSSQVAGALRRSATRRGLTGSKREAVDDCANYLLKYKKYLQYDKYLAAGLPIATGVIEGACRYLVKDRMEVTGARWSLQGAEAVLRLRSLHASGDFEEYWRFHLEQEHQRNHAPLYAKSPEEPPAVPPPRSSGHLRVIK